MNEDPVAFVCNGPKSYIQMLGMGEQLPLSVGNAIAAGPNLVKWDKETKTSVVYIPPSDFNFNIWEHSSNTAVGLRTDSTNSVATEAVFVVSDGRDSCSRKDPTCGMEAIPMAYFMKDFLKVNPNPSPFAFALTQKVTAAMEMDQGGSSTMWVKGQPFNGVVSNTPNKETRPPSPRHVANGLFIALSKK